MTGLRRVVVVGASQAGSACAAGLRARGYDGELTIVGDEVHPPYTRPPLSKGVLTGREAEDRVFLPGLGDDVVLRTATAARSLDPDRRVVRLDHGEELAYDGLVVATGARARTLAGPDAGEITVRGLDDVVNLRRLLDGARDVVVVGGGFLGMELASSCVSLGKRVTVVDRVEPLAGQLGPFLSALCRAAAEEHGVTLRVDPGTATVAADRGTPRLVLSGGGTRIAEADLVVTAAGDLPNVEWLRGSGLPLDGGLVADERCRVAPGIVAAGDVVATRHAGRRRSRLPFWSNALAQARTAVGAMLGDDAPPPPAAPYFWTELFGLRLRIAGPLPRQGDPVVVDGSLADRRALLRWPATATQAGTAVAVNDPIPAAKLTRLSRS